MFTGAMTTLQVSLFLVGVLIPTVTSYRILMTAVDISSHVYYVSRFAGLLAAQGHQVTLVLPSNVNVPDEMALDPKLQVVTFNKPGPTVTHNPKFQEIVLETAFNPAMSTAMKNFELMNDIMPEAGIRLLEDDKVMEVLKLSRYDFIIVDPASTPYYFLPYKFGVPYASLTVECMGHARRIPIMPSYIPNLTTSFTDQMNFQERMVNFLLTAFLLVYDFGGYDVSLKYVPELPVVGYNELMLNASLCLQLRENVIDFVRPEMPDIVPIANIMARASNPLPEDLKSFVEQSKHGVILISFGTIVTDIPRDTLEKIMTALQMVPYDVIFKYSGSLESLHVAPNIRVMSWIPQNDLLGHPNLKLFVTHCGMNSLIESFYHGVPLISFPFAIDQHANAALAAAKGISITLAINDFTANQLTDTIRNVLTDNKFINNAKRICSIYQDVTRHGPRDSVFWVEHVIKYGAKHLRSHAYEMPRYQYIMLDVIAFLLATGLLSLFVLWKLLRCIVCSICCRRSKEKND